MEKLLLSLAVFLVLVLAALRIRRRRTSHSTLPESSHELELLICRYVDARVSHEETRLVESLLRRDSEARRIHDEYVARVRTNGSGLTPLFASESARTDGVIKTPRKTLERDDDDTDEPLQLSPDQLKMILDEFRETFQHPRSSDDDPDETPSTT